jgi:4-hydroxybenzoate polyprenyltransferase
MAPVGAWLAVTGTVEGVAAALTLGVAVAMWTAGFDIIYACQDVEFDRRAGLRSIPETVGVARALGVSSACHAVAFAGFMGFWGAVDLGWASLGAILAIGALLVYEHRIVRPGDMTRVNTAFFTVNGLVSFAFLGGVALDNLLG